MDETKLILSAMLKDTPTPRRRKVMQEIESSPLPEKADRLLKLIKRKNNKPTPRSLSAWRNIDFLRYLDGLISPYGINREDRGILDAENLGRLYDDLASVLQQEMNHRILRDYIDWWVAMYCRTMKTRTIYTGMLLNTRQLTIFLRRLIDESGVVKQVPSTELLCDDEEVDCYTLYKLGGLPMLLMSYGIVTARRVLKEANESSLSNAIVRVLNTFSKQAIHHTMEMTLKHAPYDESDLVDFVVLARPSCKSYGLNEYIDLNYEEFFKKDDY